MQLSLRSILASQILAEATASAESPTATLSAPASRATSEHLPTADLNVSSAENVRRTRLASATSAEILVLEAADWRLVAKS